MVLAFLQKSPHVGSHESGVIPDRSIILIEKYLLFNFLYPGK